MKILLKDDFKIHHILRNYNKATDTLAKFVICLINFFILIDDFFT